MVNEPDDLLRDFVDLVDGPRASSYLEQLAATDATADRLGMLLQRFEQKIQRLERLHRPSPRDIAMELLSLTRAPGKQRSAAPAPLEGWKKLDNEGRPITMTSVMWSAALDTGRRLMWTVNADGAGDEPHPCRQVSWRGALDLLASLNFHAWCGYRDWRIPSIGELATLLHKEETGAGYRIAESLFSDLRRDAVYWSSSRFEDTRLLQALGFTDGARVARRPGLLAYLRFVRTVGDDDA